MLTDASLHKFNKVLIFKLDRLSRSVRDFSNIQQAVLTIDALHHLNYRELPPPHHEQIIVKRGNSCGVPIEIGLLILQYPGSQQDNRILTT